MIMRLENLPCKGSLKELGLFSLQKRHLREETHHSIPVLKSADTNKAESLRGHMDMAMGDRYNLHQERFHLGIRKKFFYSENNHWNNVPRDVVKSPSVEVFKLSLDRVLNNVIWTQKAGPADLLKSFPTLKVVL